MTKIMYKGPYDERGLGKADMVKLTGNEDVDWSMRTFSRGEVVEVPDAIAQTLLEHAELRNQFVEADKDEAKQEVSTDKQTTHKSPHKK